MDRAGLPTDFTSMLWIRKDKAWGKTWSSDMTIGSELLWEACVIINVPQYQKLRLWSDWIESKGQPWQQLPDWVVREDLWAVIASVSRPCVCYGPVTYIQLFTKQKMIPGNTFACFFTTLWKMQIVPQYSSCLYWIKSKYVLFTEL